MDEKNILKWEDEYINNVNLKNIEWIKLNNEELKKFLRKNYLDKDLWKYVAIRYGYLACPLGLHYLSLDSSDSYLDYKYLLGIVDNNKKTKTIVADMTYLDKYYYFIEQKKPITYITTIEVNHYFRNKGIYKIMCNEFIKFVNNNQHILVTPESEMGKKIKAFGIFKDILVKNGFKKQILINNLSYQIQNDFYDLFVENEKVLKK